MMCGYSDGDVRHARLTDVHAASHTVGGGIVLATGATVHTYGGWAQPGTAVSFLGYGVTQSVTVRVCSNITGAFVGWVDVSVIDTALGETTVTGPGRIYISKLVASHAGGPVRGNLGRVYVIPIAIPITPTTKIVARGQASVASVELRVSVTAVMQGGIGRHKACSGIEVLGTISTATSQGSTLLSFSTSGALFRTQQTLVVSATKQYAGFMLSGISVTDTAQSAITYYSSLTLGGQVVARNIAVTSNNTAEASSSVSTAVWFASAVGEGIGHRTVCTGTTDTGAAIILYGLEA